ncbi:hypothetical protein FACS189442_2060 [Spirochaetia bacterium]|nr:hypothetical protein FACS189442_2060 [Spirochaetia bacterium]
MVPPQSHIHTGTSRAAVADKIAPARFAVGPAMRAATTVWTTVGAAAVSAASPSAAPWAWPAVMTTAAFRPGPTAPARRETAPVIPTALA